MNNDYPGPPDLRLVVSEFRKRVRFMFPKFSYNPLWLIFIALLIWLATGITIVAPDEQGVKLVFGKVTSIVEPGPHWNWPTPIGRMFTPKVKRVQKLEVGFRTIDVGPPARYVSMPQESLMLTGDENIVKLEFIVQFRIQDPVDFYFHVRDPVATLKDVSESSMREVIGHTAIDQALTEGKGAIQDEAQILIQRIIDEYKAGIHIVTVKLQDVNPPDPVSDAFKDVINASQDKVRKINEAKGFENDLIPAARGEAAQMVNDAEGYRQARITEAEGEANRFLALLTEYRRAKQVTRERLYLETMEEVVQKMDQIILEGPLSANTLPYLPLNEINRPKKPAVKGENP